MENVENVEEDLIQNTYVMYEKRYESCQKKLDKLALVSDRVSLLRGITFVIAGLLLLVGYQQKNPALFVACLSPVGDLSWQAGRGTGMPERFAVCCEGLHGTF